MTGVIPPDQRQGVTGQADCRTLSSDRPTRAMFLNDPSTTLGFAIAAGNGAGLG
jgi:hypothetical protein